MPRISIITPTFGREWFLAELAARVASQTVTDWEWRILDDSPVPFRPLAESRDERIHYLHTARRLSIGEKRNRLVEGSSGEWIVHFDDDDFYAPGYLAALVERLDRGFDFVKLSGWFLYSVPYRWLGYWDCTRIRGPHYVWSGEPPQMFNADASHAEALADNYLGFGFSYAYRRAVWQAQPFHDVNWNEEGALALAARDRFRLDHFPDRQGLCLHLLHGASSTRCLPQYRLPSFMLDALFGASCRRFVDGCEKKLGDRNDPTP